MFRSPYSLGESLNWIRKIAFGASRAGAAAWPNPFPDRKLVFREVRDPFDLVFFGDIMSLARRKLEVGESLRAFVRGARGVVLNLEGPFGRPSRYPITVQLQRPSLLDDLRDFAGSESALYLSLANNHSGDLGPAALRETREAIRRTGIHPFGDAETPFVEPAPGVRIVGATEWENRSGGGVVRIDEVERHLAPNHLHLLYVHHGYEFELYPRPAAVAWANRMTAPDRVILAHHSHTPQPMVRTPEGGWIAHSLGNFATHFRNDLTNYGVAMRLRIGTDPATTRPALGAVEWTWIRCAFPDARTARVETAERLPTGWFGAGF